MTRVAENPEQLPTAPGVWTGGTATETVRVTALPVMPLSTGVALKVVVDVTDTDWVFAVVVEVSPTTAAVAVQSKLAPAGQPSAVSATVPPPVGSEAGVAVSDVQLGAPGGGGEGGVPESHVTIRLPLAIRNRREALAAAVGDRDTGRHRRRGGDTQECGNCEGYGGWREAGSGHVKVP